MKTRFQERTISKRQTARITQSKFKEGKGEHVERSVTVNRPCEELWTFWRDFTNLPRFMVHLQSVVEHVDGTSHWVMKTDKGKELEWDARLIEARPNEVISWQSLEHADVDNAGSVWFTPAPGGRGTVVRIKMRYNPPGGKVGVALSKVTGQSADKEISEDLFRFKALMEAGEVPTNEGQPRGGKK